MHTTRSARACQSQVQLTFQTCAEICWLQLASYVTREFPAHPLTKDLDKVEYACLHSVCPTCSWTARLSAVTVLQVDRLGTESFAQRAQTVYRELRPLYSLLQVS